MNAPFSPQGFSTLSNQQPLAPEFALLAQEAETLTEMLRALEQEHDALIEGDSARLEEAVAAKAAALELHAQLRAQREARGLTDISHDAIAQRPDLNEGQKATGLELIERLRASGVACQKLNNRNGMMISSLKDRTHRALTVLRGAPDVTLYGNRGNADPDMGSRVLGTA